MERPRRKTWLYLTDPLQSVSGGPTERINMARNPNYSFERLERQRAKASKKASRLKAKKERAEKRKSENSIPPQHPAGSDAEESGTENLTSDDPN